MKSIVDIGHWVATSIRSLDYPKLTQTQLVVAASRLYCQNCGVSVDKLPDKLVQQTNCSMKRCEAALKEVHSLIDSGIQKIHASFCLPQKAEEITKEALKLHAPDMDSDTIQIIYQYCSWCVAKGA